MTGQFKLRLLHSVRAIALLLLLGGLVLGLQGRQSSLVTNTPIVTNTEQRQLMQSTEKFVEHFQMTLDIGAAFDEMKMSDAVQRIRKASVPQFMGISESVIKEIDDPTARRLYVAATNYYYLSSLYAFSVKNGATSADLAKPTKVIEALRKSRWLRAALPAFRGDEPEVSTSEELREYIGDLERVAGLYREYLPPRVFESQIFKSNLATFKKKREAKPFEVRLGDHDFGISDATTVYVVRQSVFAIYYVKEGGKFRILHLGIGE